MLLRPMASKTLGFDARRSEGIYLFNAWLYAL